MPDIPDLRLRQSSVSDHLNTGEIPDLFVEEQPIKEDQTKWIILIVLFIMSAVVVGYIVFQRQRAKTPLAVAAPVAAPAAPAPAKPATGPLVQAENIPLPPLAETDALVRQLLVKLSSHPKVLAWLATNGLIENFTVATLNISDGKSPALMHWRNLTPESRFTVVNTTGGTMLDAKSYRRYDAYAAAIRQEFIHVSDSDYRAGRAKVLRQFAARPVIYPDAGFAAIHDRQARDNLARELASLS